MILIEPIPVTESVFVAGASNVLENDHAAWSSTTTYAKGNRVIKTSTHKVYESLIDSNLNKDPETNLTGATPAWLEISTTNRWKMFDAQNNTQTTNPESIAVQLKPVFIANGVYLGNLDADSVTVTVTDAVEGLVYSQTKDLSVSNSASSFWNWCFRRIVKKTAVAFTGVPMYANATIGITVTKTGGTAKCGMCVAGPVVDVGITEMGVSTDIKDFSTTTFNADGTSKTVVRGFSKRMTVDLVIENDVKDSIENQLAAYRQTPVVWIASHRFETTMIYGKFSSFKNVIEGFVRSRMSLQIEGMV